MMINTPSNTATASSAPSPVSRNNSCCLHIAGLVLEVGESGSNFSMGGLWFSLDDLNYSQYPALPMVRVGDYLEIEAHYEWDGVTGSRYRLTGLSKHYSTPKRHIVDFDEAEREGDKFIHSALDASKDSTIQNGKNAILHNDVTNVTILKEEDRENVADLQRNVALQPDSVLKGKSALGDVTHVNTASLASGCVASKAAFKPPATFHSPSANAKTNVKLSHATPSKLSDSDANNAKAKVVPPAVSSKQNQSGQAHATPAKTPTSLGFSVGRSSNRTTTTSTKNALPSTLPQTSRPAFNPNDKTQLNF